MGLPKFFGLDIGNHSIKAIRLNDPTSSRPYLMGYAYGRTPAGVLNISDSDMQRRLADAIRRIIDSSSLAGVKQVSFAVPESYAVKRFMTLPAAEEENIETAVVYEMKKWLPYPLEEARINKIIIGEKIVSDARVVDVLGVAVRVSYLDRYVETLEMAGLEPIGAETEGVSIARVIGKVSDLTSSYIVIDIGSSSTDVSVGFKNRLIYADSIPYGSDSITKAIAQTFSMDLAKAEEYKKTYGIDPVNFGGKLADVVAPVLDLILDDVKKIVEYFKREISEISPSKIFLTGETAGMPGLVDYVSKKLGIMTERLNPVAVLNGRNADLVFLEKNSSAYTVALGLALKTDF